MKRLALILGMMIASTGAFAQPVITLGEPGYGGTGCPAGSVSVTLSPDQTALSLLFDGYLVEAGGTSGHSFDRKSCNIAIPVHVPQGLSVSIIAVDYRGFNQLPAGGRSQFNVEYFFAGGRGPVFRRDFNGPLSSDYLIQNELVAQAIVWSACGADVNLRTNSSMRVTTTANREALATVDSEDVSAAIIYSLQWRPCLIGTMQVPVSTTQDLHVLSRPGDGAPNVLSLRGCKELRWNHLRAADSAASNARIVPCGPLFLLFLPQRCWYRRGRPLPTMAARPAP